MEGYERHGEATNHVQVYAIGQRQLGQIGGQYYTGARKDLCWYEHLITHWYLFYTNGCIDAKGDVLRGLQVAEGACNIPQQMMGEVLEVAKDMETRSYREPLGVVASICPFSKQLQRNKAPRLTSVQIFQP